MKAVIWTAYGKPEVLQLRELEKPVPKRNEVLVQVRATAVTAGDCRLRGFKIPIGLWLPTRLAFGLFKPRRSVLGMDFSGEVEAVGRGVSLFKEGDRVFGTTGMRLGANAEHVCINEEGALVKIPLLLTHEDAASLIFGGLTALHFLLNKVKIKAGDKVLINGASGSVGTAALQIAGYRGAEVTSVCSAGNHELVRSIGTDNVIDYTKEDFTDNGVKYDVILDTVGNLSYSRCRNSLSKEGRLILINAGLGTILSSLSNNKLVCGVAGESKSALGVLVDLFESGQLKPVVDRIYPLQRVVDAHRYVDIGHKKGNVVLKVLER